MTTTELISYVSVLLIVAFGSYKAGQIAGAQDAADWWKRRLEKELTSLMSFYLRHLDELEKQNKS